MNLELVTGDRIWAWLPNNGWTQVTFRRWSAGGDFAVVDTDRPWPWVSAHVPIAQVRTHEPKDPNDY